MSVIISADSHVLEPVDLWVKALGQRYGDKVPHIVERFGGHEGTYFYLGREGEAARADARDTGCARRQRVIGATAALSAALTKTAR